MEDPWFEEWPQEDELDEPRPEVAAKEVYSSKSNDVCVKPSPELPSREEVEKQDTTHCPVCLRASAKEDSHPRRGHGRDATTGLPVVAMDYELMEENLIILIMKDESSGAKLAYDCTAKGPGDTFGRAVAGARLGRPGAGATSAFRRTVSLQSSLCRRP